jgi:hypothetical protein
MCTHFLHHIHPPTSFPHHLPDSHRCQPSSLGRTCSVLFSDFVEEKKRKEKMKNMTF